jgi:tetratricopeptide (TPR) repeat protein
MNKPGQVTAMISSTAVDLPEHRKQVVEACLREGVFPIGMEQLPARDATGIQASLDMVDKADIYIGIYAWRYGWVPDLDNPEMISITEMEFNRALELKQRGKLKEILIFVMHEDHPIRARDKEDGAEAQDKLKKFKERASAGRVRLTFASSEELRGHVIQSLADAKRRIEAAAGSASHVPDFHPPNLIPKPPEPYIAHPYSLLQTKDVVGRQAELNLLTDWVTTNREVPTGMRIFNLVAIGGMGKSALTWKWFNDIAPNELPKLAGRMWWSFYESDAHWENFIIRALAYVSGQSEKTVREMKAPDREDQLWRILDQQPFLLVLDGLERILLAYARMDAAQMLDEDLDDKTANRVAQSIGLPPSAADSFIGKHQLRRTADHRAGHFLRRLTQIRNSHVLITTRLYPTELQCETGAPLPGCYAQFLAGLTDSDALNLWREFKVTGSTEQLLPLFRSFNNYPLLIRALAGEVAAFRGGPGDFDKWRAKNPNFDPTRLPLKNAKTHVLEYALRGLKPEHRKVLHTIAAFRMPATWETLRALLVDDGKAGHQSVHDSKGNDGDAVERVPSKPCATDQALDLILTELEDRGLVGWDRRANRYDLHPIVRSVVWNTLNKRSRRVVLRKLYSYFDAVPKVEDWHSVEKLEDLTPALELYNTLIGLGQIEEAFGVFFERLDSVTDYRLSASRLRIELLNPLIEITDGGTARVGEPANLLHALHALGRAWLFAGEPREAAGYLNAGVSLSEQSPLLSGPDLGCLADFSGACRVGGHLFEAQIAAFKVLANLRKYSDSFQEGSVCVSLGFVFAACGQKEESDIALRRAIRFARSRRHTQFEGFVSSARAQRDLWFSNAPAALAHAMRAFDFAKNYSYERDFIRTARLQGAAALEMGEMTTAMEHLNHALFRARQVDFVEEELRTIIAMAEWHRQKRNLSGSHELLEQIWAPAEGGPYPLFHSDALNVLGGFKLLANI